MFALEEGKATVKSPEACIGCGHCGAICPTRAVRHDPTADSAPVGPGPAVSAEDLLRLIRERRSIRLYRPDPLPQEILQTIVDGARYTPTGSNRQNVRWLILTSPGEIDRLRREVLGFYQGLFQWVLSPWRRPLLSLVAGRRTVANLREYAPLVERGRERMEAGEDPLLFQAPAVILVHAESWDTCSAFNGATALWNASLLAHAHGLGCCFNGFVEGAFRSSRKLRDAFGLPRDHRCYGAMTLGWPVPSYRRLVERSPAEIRWS